MPTIVDILVLISRKNFMLNWFEHEKSFITLGPGEQYTTHSMFLSRDMEKNI